MCEIEFNLHWKNNMAFYAYCNLFSFRFDHVFLPANFKSPNSTSHCCNRSSDRVLLSYVNLEIPGPVTQHIRVPCFTTGIGEKSFFYLGLLLSTYLCVYVHCSGSCSNTNGTTIHISKDKNNHIWEVVASYFRISYEAFVPSTSGPSSWNPTWPAAHSSRHPWYHVCTKPQLQA